MTNGTQNLMLLTAALMDTDDLINLLKTALKDYENATPDKKEDALETLQMHCALLMTKRIAPTVEEAMKLGQRMDEHTSMLKILNSDKNKN